MPPPEPSGQKGPLTAMQIRLTVLGPRSGHTTRACDVLVTAPAGTALAAVAGGLAAAVAGSAADTGSGGGAAGTGGSGPVVLYAGAERLDAQRAALGEPPLIDGAVLSLQGPGPAPAHGLPEAAARLQVVSGPDAGGVHLLHGGQIRIGRSADADVPLDDPDVSRLHCAVTLEPDGSVLVADLRSTNGTSVDGTEIDERPAPLPSGPCCASASPPCASGPPPRSRNRPCRPRPTVKATSASPPSPPLMIPSPAPPRGAPRLSPPVPPRGCPGCGPPPTTSGPLPPPPRSRPAPPVTSRRPRRVRTPRAPPPGLWPGPPPGPVPPRAL
ncbi:FHA domain-containing protein [Streptomyces sp. MST-110588]|uniref:FHA domain-containing protein n=1 Tax=Streptomyces sp. MST-110588 TaxID=2833628 RepID=UPI003242ADBF